MQVFSQKRESGMTIIEILVVMSIIAIIAAVTLPNFRSMKQLNDLEAGRVIVLHALEQARSRALSGVGNTHHGVVIDERAVHPYEGASDDVDGTIPLPLSVMTNQNNTPVTFHRLTGQVIENLDDGLTITITDTDGAEEIILIHQNGSIQTQ